MISISPLFAYDTISATLDCRINCTTPIKQLAATRICKRYTTGNLLVLVAVRPSGLIMFISGYSLDTAGKN